jgi:hypothetical protein
LAYPGKNYGGLGWNVEIRFTTVDTTGFSVAEMVPDDQYEVHFTVGSSDFAMVFKASGPSSGTLKLFHKGSGEPSWTEDESLTAMAILQEEIYQPVSQDIGFKLRSSASSYGYLKFIAKKGYLVSLGASGDMVSNIFSATFADGTGQPIGGTNDRCPISGGADWPLEGPIPEFPLGLLLLAFPVLVTYIYFRRRPGVRFAPPLRKGP